MGRIWSGPGASPRARFVCRSYIWAMTPIRPALVALLIPSAALAQDTPAATARPATPAAPTYRGFAPGAPYRDFVERARALAVGDTLRCNTSRNTAQLMECGVSIRDPADSAQFYVSAYVLESNVAMVAFYDSAGFGGGGGGAAAGAALVDRTKRSLASVFGQPRPIGHSGWEWRYGRQVVRFNWRGRGTARWISITLTDNDVLDRIGRYVKAVSGKR